MMSILPVLGMAIKDGKTLTLNEDSRWLEVQKRGD